MMEMPFCVISVEKNAEEQNKYFLNIEELKKNLEPIKNMPVALIPIVGPSRQKNEFILNYMTHFLLNPKHLQWFEEIDTTHRGFDWKSDTEPQTSGLWMSQPFIVDQSNGNKIAVLLTEAQGTFDEHSKQKDWSKLLGISLLISSCIIFNLFTNLKEEVLLSLEYFLQYGIQAMKAIPESEKKPFMNLLFLIHDWNEPKRFKYGLKGGKMFLDFKLDLKPEHSETNRFIRNVLKNCFEGVSCFLLPKIEAEEEESIGSIDIRKSRYFNKLKEFIEYSLNPNDLEPKYIDNHIIKAEDLIEYFKTYVDIFNNADFPTTTDLFEATIKTRNLIQMNKIKLTEDLEKLDDNFRSEICTSKVEPERSNSEAVISALSFYGNKMDEVLGVQVYLSADKFEEYEQKFENESEKHFKEKCSGDSKFRIKYEKNFDTNLKQLKSEFKSKYQTKCESLLKSKVDECEDSYSNGIEDLFDDDKSYSDEQLKELHTSLKEKTNDLLNEYLVSINLDFHINAYSKELNESIDRKYERIHIKNKRKFKESELRELINKFKTEYETQIEICVNDSNDERELIGKHRQLENQIISKFKQGNESNGNSFEIYLNKIKEMINKSFGDALKVFQFNIKIQKSNEEILMTKIRKYYREEMAKYYQKTSYLPKEKLFKNHDSVFNSIFAKFESERGVMSSKSYSKLIKDCVKDIYEKITADNHMNTPTIAAIGIDLGTTNSCVGYYKPGLKNKNSVVIIPDVNGSMLTPSYVAFKGDQKIVGMIAKEEAYKLPRNTIYSIKRLIGRKFNEDSVQNDIQNLDYKVIDDGMNNPKIKIDENGESKMYIPEQISAEVLKKMKEIAENYLGFKVTNAVITVPAYFNDEQKKSTKFAGKLAGLKVLKIINEPTAAAIAFQQEKSYDDSSRKVLIYDFGGGTFDVAVLNIEKGDINVMAVGGDNHLGGDDIDNNLVDHCLDEFRIQTGITVSKTDPNAVISRLRFRCEKRKCELSSAQSTTITVDNFYNGKDLRVNLTRDKFEDLNEQLFIKSMDLVAQTLEDAGLKHDNIDDIVLVGGTTRIPRIQEMLSDQFSGKPLNHQVNPDEAVAVGAAIQAAILNGQQAQNLGYIKVTDVAPMSLGVKAKGGLMSVIIPRNSKVPNIYERHYTTTSDFQTSVDVVVYEGNEEMVERNKYLGNFELTGIPGAPVGEQVITVYFEITDEGILRVKARISSTGKESEELKIEEHKGRISEQELEKLIKQGNTN